MEQFLQHYGYIALSIGTFFEGETAILVASSLAAASLFNIPLVVIFGFLGSFLSDWVYYIIGRLNGKYFVNRRPKLKARLEPVQKFFKTHRLQILLSYRFLYGFRIVIPLMFGMSDIKPIHYLGYTVAAGLMWASTVSAVGYLVGLVLELRPQSFESNLPAVMLGFACFGLLMGYSIKRFAEKKLRIQN